MLVGLQIGADGALAARLHLMLDLVEGAGDVHYSNSSWHHINLIYHGQGAFDLWQCLAPCLQHKYTRLHIPVLDREVGRNLREANVTEAVAH